MRRTRPFAMSLSFAVACAAAVGCSPDRQSGMSKSSEPAAPAAASETPQPQPTAVSAAPSYSEQTPESAAAISGLEMPDAKSMLITDESMSGSLSAPTADPIAPHGQSMPQPPIVPALSK